MEEKNRRILELNIAIVLSVILLLVVIVVFAKRGQEKTPEVKKIKQEKQIVTPGTQISRTKFKKNEGSGFLKQETTVKKTPPVAEQKEKAPKAVMLKNLPLETISPEEKEPEPEILEQATGKEVIKRPSKVQPGLEDIKRLKQKGLIIY